MDLSQLGWGPFFEGSMAGLSAKGWEPARVVAEHRGGYRICGVHGEMAGEVCGRLRHELAGAGDRPAVGDWVAVVYRLAENKAILQAVLNRRTKFSRTAAGRSREEQVLAANLDDVFLVASLEGTPNLRSLERYLALAWESGARPHVVLTKADLCADVPAALARVEAAAGGARVHVVSAVTGEGMGSLEASVEPCRTVAFLGPSGAGKSTLINRWCGEEVMDTQEVRGKDLKGRHTTTHRQMIPAPSGVLIIDTPGMRELQLWEGEEGVGEAFAEIDALALGCRFSNCRHEDEPACAVQEAMRQGALEPARLASYRKLRRELAHHESKSSPRARLEERQRTKSIAKQFRHHPKKGR